MDHVASSQHFQANVQQVYLTSDGPASLSTALDRISECSMASQGHHSILSNYGSLWVRSRSSERSHGEGWRAPRVALLLDMHNNWSGHSTLCRRIHPQGGVRLRRCYGACWYCKFVELQLATKLTTGQIVLLHRRDGGFSVCN